VQALKSATATEGFSVGQFTTCSVSMSSSESHTGPAPAAELITATADARRLERTRRMRTTPLRPCTSTASDQNKEKTK
jgi:hypothetical protein